ERLSHCAAKRRDERVPLHMNCHATLPRGSCNGGDDITPNVLRCGISNRPMSALGLGRVKTLREVAMWGCFSQALTILGSRPSPGVASATRLPAFTCLGGSSGFFSHGDDQTIAFGSS